MASLEQEGGSSKPRAGPEPFSPSVQMPNLTKLHKHGVYAGIVGSRSLGVQCFDTKLKHYAP